MSQDIGDSSLGSSATLVVTSTLNHVEGPAGPHRPVRRAPDPPEVAARYGVHRAWVDKLKARYEAEGDTAFEPRSRRPKNSPNATPAALVDQVLLLGKQLAEAGLDAGAETIGWHLQHHHQATLSRATINRILTRAGAVTPEPAKRPKSSYTRFQAAMPNQTWQSDFTHYRLADGSGTEIISWLNDCARYALSVTAHARVTTDIVKATLGCQGRSGVVARHLQLGEEAKQPGGGRQHRRQATRQCGSEPAAMGDGIVATDPRKEARYGYPHHRHRRLPGPRVRGRRERVDVGVRHRPRLLQQRSADRAR